MKEEPRQIGEVPQDNAFKVMGLPPWIVFAHNGGTSNASTAGITVQLDIDWLRHTISEFFMIREHLDPIQSSGISVALAEWIDEKMKDSIRE